jgi:hypothetical protein
MTVFVETSKDTPAGALMKTPALFARRLICLRTPGTGGAVNCQIESALEALMPDMASGPSCPMTVVPEPGVGAAVE